VDAAEAKIGTLQRTIEDAKSQISHQEKSAVGSEALLDVRNKDLIIVAGQLTGFKQNTGDWKREIADFSDQGNTIKGMHLLVKYLYLVGAVVAEHVGTHQSQALKRCLKNIDLRRDNDMLVTQLKTAIRAAWPDALSEQGDRINTEVTIYGMIIKNTCWHRRFPKNITEILQGYGIT